MMSGACGANAAAITPEISGGIVCASAMTLPFKPSISP